MVGALTGLGASMLPSFREPSAVPAMSVLSTRLRHPDPLGCSWPTPFWETEFRTGARNQFAAKISRLPDVLGEHRRCCLAYGQNSVRRSITETVR
jgi:hypothetical protein